MMASANRLRRNDAPVPLGRDDEMRVVTVDAFPLVSFPIKRSDADFHISKRQFVVSGPSVLRLRAQLGSQLRVRTFSLFDDFTHSVFRACYVLDTGLSACTFTFERRTKIVEE